VIGLAEREQMAQFEQHRGNYLVAAGRQRPAGRRRRR
jgi:hypothetical protein